MDSKIFARFLALFAVFAVFVLADARLISTVRNSQPLGVDFLAIWAGVGLALEQPSQLYDFTAVTQAQQDVLGAGSNLRPFVYPPSAVPVFAPFAWLDFWTAYVGFLLLTGALYLHAAWRMSGRLVALVLLVAAPVVMLSVLAGQVSFLVGGLVLSALSARTRPVFAGVMLGIAAAIKPQVLVLFPLALALEGRWRALAAAVASGGMLGLASLVLVGPLAWMDWLAALPRFTRLVAEDGALLNLVITPIGALARLGVEGPALIVAQAGCVLAGAALVWWTFTRKTSEGQRLTALIGGSLLIAPYAMGYELALIAPAVVAVAADVRDARWLYYFLALMLLSLLVPGLVALVGLLACVVQPWPGADARRDGNIATPSG